MACESVSSSKKEINSSLRAQPSSIGMIYFLVCCGFRGCLYAVISIFRIEFITVHGDEKEAMDTGLGFVAFWIVDP